MAKSTSGQITVYGLKNCDTCRKAMKWLASKGADARLHDVRDEGLPKGKAKSWIQTFGPETVINQRSTTWRGLSEGERSGLTPVKALALLASHPALLKRPVFDMGDAIIIGFKAPQQKKIEQHL